MSFSDLHQPGNPLVLFNIWDAGSARAIAREGASALATGSASVAGAWGYADGEAIPFDLLITVVQRICAVSELPLTVDFEAGYGDSEAEVAANAARLEAAGAVGINLEDGLPPESGIRTAAEQAARISAIRHATGLFINSRTDLFLQNPVDAHADLMAEATDRAKLYADSGADGFFVPGLVDRDLIRTMCRDCPLPVNIMKSPKAPAIPDLAALGVARISFGPFPWLDAMRALAGLYRDQVVAGA